MVPAGMRRECFPAMGTTVSLLAPVSRAAEAAYAVEALFARWEQTLSRFRSDSELSHLNARAGEAVAVSPLLYDVTSTALAAASTTEGLYDPTLLYQMVQLGYDRSFQSLPPLIAAMTAPLHAGGRWREVRLDAARRRVTLPPRTGLDLGGIAKGMAVDAALAELRQMGIADALVNAGGDLAVCGLPPDADAWSIVVAGQEESHPLPLHHGAVATSGVARRRWRQGREQRHHLLDPRTGAPARSGLWSATVVAARCAQAEVAAKAAFVLGPVAGAEFLQARGLAGLLIGDDGACRHAGAWPALVGERP